MTEPATPKIVTRDEWEQARAELLVREKAHTHAGDELAAARRRLPMTRMEPVMVVGRSGPWSEIIAYRDFMGWTTPWYSTADAGNVLKTRTGGDLRCYLRAGDEVFQTYETKWRGIEAMLPTLQLLDLTAYGRQETWEDSPAGWPRDKAGSWWRRDGRPIAQWTRTDATVK